MKRENGKDDPSYSKDDLSYSIGNAGYSKDHVGLFYEKLLKMEQQRGGNEGMLKSLSDAMSTHPPSKERVAQMNEMAQRASNKSNAIVSTNDFARMRQLAQQISSAKKS